MADTLVLQQIRELNGIEVSKMNHRTQTKQWKQAATTEEATIRDLLLKDVKEQKKKHCKLALKLNQMVGRVNILVTQTSLINDKQSDKLGQSPILSILSKTIATYMLLRNLNP